MSLTARKMLNLVEHWTCEYILANGDPKDQTIIGIREVLYEPHKIEEREDAEKRIKPAQKGVEGGLNINRDKPAVKITSENIGQILPGLAPAKPVVIAPNDEGELEITPS